MREQVTPPIVCDMSGAPDTLAERLAEYRDLFADALVGRERIDEDAIQFRFRARPGLLDRVNDLAAREKACCAFFDFVISEHGDEIWWDARVPDDPIAHEILDAFYMLPS